MSQDYVTHSGQNCSSRLATAGGSAEEQFPPVAFTVITSATGSVAKGFELGENGKLIKRSHAEVYEGQAQRVAVADLAHLLQTIEKLNDNQALCFGVTDVPTARVVTQRTLKSGTVPGAIARDRAHFRYAARQPGILMLDFDQRKGYPPKDWQELDDIMCGLLSGWAETERMWRASSSAYVYRISDGAELIGVGGWRCYVIVDDASAIPMVTARIHQEAWKQGYGYIQISELGGLLDRSLIDTSVSQPERLDFAAAPVLGSDLERRAPHAVILPGKRLETQKASAALTLPEWRKLSPELRKAREAIRPAAEKARKRYVAKRIATLQAEGLETGERELTEACSLAAEHRMLTPSFVLHSEDGQKVTVAELLADPAKWDGTRFADPLEPGYAGDPRIAYANLSATKPCIYSHAHGGIVYRLVREKKTIIIERGERPRIVDECLAVMREAGDMYEYGGELTLLDGEYQTPVTIGLLGDYLARRIRFLQWHPKLKDYVPADVPDKVCRDILEKGQHGRELPRLNGVITAPTLRADGSLLCQPGYDGVSGLLLHGEDFPRIPETTDDAGLRAAYETLGRPFRDFPYVDAAAHGVVLAALLTAVVRRTLPAAPAIFADAAMAGTGKTLLLQCFLRLGGAIPAVLPASGDENEFRKRLLAILREGEPGFLLDNVRDEFSSASLEAFLTSQTFKDRVLGVSRNAAYPTNVMVLISGNNLLLMGDLWRRVLTVRLDARTDTPERRTFALNPLEYCRIHRSEMVAAALVILRAFIAAGKPRSVAAPERIGSFEAWDDLIRQCVLWLSEKGITTAGDPAATMQAAKERVPERQELARLLDAAFRAFGNDKWRVTDLMDRCLIDEALREAVNDIALERGSVNPRVLGKWLGRNIDKRCGGKYLVRVEQSGASHSSVRWRVCCDSPIADAQPKRAGNGAAIVITDTDIDESDICGWEEVI